MLRAFRGERVVGLFLFRERGIQRLLRGCDIGFELCLRRERGSRRTLGVGGCLLLRDETFLRGVRRQRERVGLLLQFRQLRRHRRGVRRRVRQIEGALECLREHEFADEGARVEFYRRDPIAEQIEQRRDRGRIRRVMQIQRLHQPAAKHDRPEPVRDVAPECRVMPVAERRREQGAPAEFRHGAQRLVLRIGRHRPFTRRRLRQFLLAGEPRPGAAADLRENGKISRVARRLFADEARLFRVGPEQVRAAEKCLEPRVVALEIVVNARMVVALRARDVAPEEEPPRILRERVRVHFAFEDPARDVARFLVRTVGGDHLAHQRVPRFVRGKGLLQPFAPRPRL